MATKTVVCPECDAPLSPGRFACSSCGALVASVATVSRSFTQAQPLLPPILSTAIAAEPARPPVVEAAPTFDEPLPPRLARVLPQARRAATPPRAEKPDPIAVAVPPPAPRPPRRNAARPAATTQQAPLVWSLDDAEPAQLSTAPIEPVELPIAPIEAAEVAEVVEVSSLEPEPVPVPSRQTGPQPELNGPSSAASTPSWPAHPTWPPPRPANSVEPVEIPGARVVAGAYLPPSAVLPPGDALPLPGAERRDDPAEPAERPRRELGIPKLHLRLGEGTGPLGMPAEAPTRIVVLGASIAGLGFLLPWARVVIGSQQIGGYLAQWGLAGPGHLAVLALIVGLAVLALVAARLPRWVRLGLPTIALAFLLAGLLWPYLVGNFQTSIGVYVVAVGAIVMIAGGLLDRVATRHAESTATV